MEWILVAIIAMLILSLIWFVIEYEKYFRKDRERFEEYFENYGRIKFKRSGKGRGIRILKKHRSSFSR